MPTIMTIVLGGPIIPTWADWDGNNDGSESATATNGIFLSNNVDLLRWDSSNEEHDYFTVSGTTITAQTAVDEPYTDVQAFTGTYVDNPDVAGGFFHISDRDGVSNSQSRAMTRKLDGTASIDTGVTVDQPRDGRYFNYLQTNVPNEGGWAISNLGSSSTIHYFSFMSDNGASPTVNLSAISNSNWSSNGYNPQYAWEPESQYWFGWRGRTSSSTLSNRYIVVSSEYVGTPSISLETGPTQISAVDSGNNGAKYSNVYRLAEDTFIVPYWGDGTGDADLKIAYFTVNNSTYSVVHTDISVPEFVGIDDTEGGYDRFRVWIPRDNEMVLHDSSDGTNWFCTFTGNSAPTVVENATKVELSGSSYTYTSARHPVVLDDDRVYIQYNESGIKAKIISIV